MFLLRKELRLSCGDRASVNLPYPSVLVVVVVVVVVVTGCTVGMAVAAPLTKILLVTPSLTMLLVRVVTIVHEEPLNGTKHTVNWKIQTDTQKLTS